MQKEDPTSEGYIVLGGGALVSAETKFSGKFKSIDQGEYLEWVLID